MFPSVIYSWIMHAENYKKYFYTSCSFCNEVLFYQVLNFIVIVSNFCNHMEILLNDTK